LTVDTAVIQNRVSGTCTSVQGISAVADNGTVTCQTFWSPTGNAGATNDFLGTTTGSTVDLLFKSKGFQVMQFQGNATSPNLLGGFNGNTIATGAVGAVIGGGGFTASVNTVTDDYGVVAGGAKNQAGDNAGTTSDKQYATVSGGSTNTASGSYSSVPGGLQAAATNYGQQALASGTFTGGTAGNAQGSLFVLRNATTNATATSLFLDGSTTRISFGANRTVMFDILLVARSSTGVSASWQVSGMAKSDATGAVTFPTGGAGAPTFTQINRDTGAPANTWAVTLNTVTVSGVATFNVQVTGTAATNVRWVATVRTAEVVY
jgi:hypothetical protein